MPVSLRRRTRLVLLWSLAAPTGCSTVIGIDGNYSDSSSGGTVSDAGPGGAGGTVSDAGPGGGGTVSEAGLGGGGGATCSGAPVSGLCWYLGELGESCSSACASHGGESPNAASFVGTAAQGGSRSKCATLLTALGSKVIPLQAARNDGSGLGCHYFGDRTYWLFSPQYSPSSQNSAARLVCGCQQ